MRFFTLIVFNLFLLAGCQNNIHISNTGSSRHVEAPTPLEMISGVYLTGRDSAFLIDKNLTFKNLKIENNCLIELSDSSISINHPLNGKTLQYSNTKNSFFTTLYDHSIHWHLNNHGIDYLSIDEIRFSGPLALGNIELPLSKESTPLPFCP